MEGTRLSPVLLAAALALAGCCHGKPTGTTAILNRDTPENAFEFVRAAFAEDRPADQFDSFHPEFTAEQGFGINKYLLARSLSPGTFEKARRLLAEARLDGEPEYLRNGDLRAVRLHLRTAEGAGTFILLDRPQWEATLDDPDLPSLRGAAGNPDSVVRIEGNRLRVTADLPLDFPPIEGARVHRFTIHHDWLLRHIESLEGFEEFLGEVKATEEKAKEAPK
jgi:hypothetical protein